MSKSEDKVIKPVFSGTYRIYDKVLGDELSLRFSNEKCSMNKFITDLIEQGLIASKASEKEPRTESVKTDSIAFSLDELKTIVMDGTVIVAGKLEDVVNRLEVISRILSCLYNLELLKQEGQSVGLTVLENGMLDFLPKRFSLK